MGKKALVEAARAAHHKYLKAKAWGADGEALQWARLRDSHMRWALCMV